MACLRLYERTLALFWVMKNLMGHVLWDHMEKEEGGATLVQCWKVNHVETSRLNAKMDEVLEALGILPSSPPT